MTDHSGLPGQRATALSSGKKLIFTLFSLLVVLVISELGVRIWGGMDPGHHAFVQSREEMTGLPQTEAAIDRSSETQQAPEAEFNSAGMRDYEYSLSKPDSTFRILGMGDSITFGWFVSVDKIYLKRLERVLNTRHKPESFEVISAGVPGWNAQYERAYFSAKGQYYDPDLIIIGYCLNDADPSLPPADLFLTDRENRLYAGSLTATALEWVRWQRSDVVEHLKSESTDGDTLSTDLSPPSIGDAPESDTTFAAGQQLRSEAQEEQFRGSVALPFGLKAFLADHLHLYRFLRWRYDLILKRFGVRLEYPFTLYLNNADGWRLNREALETMAGIAKEKRIKIVLVIFPFFLKLDEDYPWEQLHRMVSDAGQAFGMVVVDLLPHFRGLNPDQVGVDPYHPNDEGHRIAAEAIYQALVENDLVSDTQTE